MTINSYRDYRDQLIEINSFLDAHCATADYFLLTIIVVFPSNVKE